MSELRSKITQKLIEFTPPFAIERVANALLRIHEEKLMLDLNDDKLETRELANWYQWNRDLSASDPRGEMGISERAWYLLNANQEMRNSWIDLKKRFDNMGNFGATEDMETFRNKYRVETSIAPYVADFKSFTDYREMLFGTYMIATKNNTQPWDKDKTLSTRAEIGDRLKKYLSIYDSQREKLDLEDLL